MELKKDELERIIESGEFDKLKGKRETDFLDCKSEIYNFKNDESKYKLAKDVSAFGNANGGFILIGIKTEKCKNHHSDEIVDVRSFRESLCNPTQYLNTIREWIFPEFKDIEAKWYPTNTNSLKGIFVLKIPPQGKYSKPFLITRTQLKTGKFTEVLFGYCKRKQEFNDPKSVEEMHQVFREGLFFKDYLDLRFEELKLLLCDSKIKISSIETKVRQPDIEQRIKTTLSAIGLEKKRFMILSAYSTKIASLKTLFSSELESIKLKLENPPSLRSNGFDLKTLDTAKIHLGEFCRVKYGENKVLDLYKDGNFICALKGDEDFLCWAMQGLKINPVVLIESIYDFVTFYKLVLEDMDRKSETAIFRVDFRNFHLNNRKNNLVPYGIRNHKNWFNDDLKYAPKDNWNKDIEITLDSYNEASISFVIVKEIYLYFGHEIEKIPYTKKIDSKRIIDIEQIKNI